MKESGISKVNMIRGKCEGCFNPIGIDTAEPYFGWVFPEPGIYQKSYRISVWNEKSEFWDSGRINSPISQNIPYDGIALENMTRYCWKVSVKTSNGDIVESDTFHFTTGYIDVTSIGAKWIEYPGECDNPVFYGDFYAREDLKYAFAAVSGLGCYEMKINGERAHDTYNVPGWTDYGKRDLENLLYPYSDNSSKRVLYNVLDVGGHVGKGPNRFEIMLGNGFFNQVERNIEGDMSYGAPRLLAEIHLIYGDGERKIISTDDSAFCTQGFLEFNNIYLGEKRNDNIGMVFNGDTTADVVDWEPENFESSYTGFDRITDIFKPEEIGEGLYDAGKNLSGRVRIKAEGPRGSSFSIRYFDAFTDSGEPDYSHSGGEWQIQENSYVFGENIAVDYAETFGWRGFRYFTIENDPDIAIKGISVEEIHPEKNKYAFYKTDSLIINGIYDAFVNSQLSNMHSGVPSDCPHRERLGYTGDGQVVSDAALLAVGNAGFYKKWNRDIVLSQNKKTGFVPHTVPFYGGGGGPAWGSACAIVPWNLYSHVFDKRILAESYDTIVKWIGYLEDRSEDLIVVREEEGSWCLGDWCMPVDGYAVEEVDLDKILSSLDPRLVNTCYFHHCCEIAVKAGEALGRETLYFKKLAERIKKSFNDEFYDAKTGRYTESGFYPNVYPLYFGMVPESEVRKVAKRLAEDITNSGYAMKTGIFATSMIFNVLADNGYLKIISSMLERRDFPSFGHMMESGATTLWETWDGKASLNHPMFGGVCLFFQRYLAGLRYMSPDGMFLIQPFFIDGINELESCIESLYGPVLLKWRKEESGDSIYLDIELPGNTKGAVKIGGKIIKVENGKLKGSFGTGVGL